MYDLPRHKEHDEQVIRDFIGQYPFAFLSGCDAHNKPVATQIPLFLEEKDGKKILRGHLMKHTDHHNAFVHNENVLAVFTGKSTYVSGTWYTNPYIPSTWNYMSVHAQGLIRFLDQEALEDALRMISLHFENYDPDSTTTYDHLSPEMKKRFLTMIVAFEIEITELKTVFKLSQDRDYESYRNIIRELYSKGPDAAVIADEMQKRIFDVFPENKT